MARGRGGEVLESVYLMNLEMFQSQSKHSVVENFIESTPVSFLDI